MFWLNIQTAVNYFHQFLCQETNWKTLEMFLLVAVTPRNLFKCFLSKKNDCFAKFECLTIVCSMCFGRVLSQ